MLSVAEISLPLKKYGIQLIAGEKGSNKKITSIDVQEFALKSTRINKGSMILTTFLGYADQALILEHFEWYVQLGISAMGIHNVSFKEIPKALLEIANNNDIPLFLIPHEVAYHKIYDIYIEEIQLRQLDEKQSIDNLYEKMINGLISGKKKQQTLQLLGDFLKEWVVYYDNQLMIQAVWYEGEISGRSEFRKFSKQLPMEASNAFLQTKNNKKSLFYESPNNSNLSCWIYPLPSNTQFFGYLVISANNSSNSLMKDLVIKNAQTVLILEAIQDNQIKTSYENRDILLFEDLLFTNLYKEMPFELFFTSIIDFDQMAIFSVKDKSTIQKLYSKIKNYLEQFSMGISWIRGEEILVLCSIKHREILIKFALSFSEVYLALSGQRTDLSLVSYKNMYEQAKVSLALSRKSKEKISQWGELGLNYLFSQLDNETVRNIVMKKVNEINDEELLKTLKIFIENNYSFKASSEVMFLHPNTIKYRVQKIETMIGQKINTNEIGLEWLIYLKLYEYFKME